jgi:hypothetical protein
MIPARCGGRMINVYIAFLVLTSADAKATIIPVLFTAVKPFWQPDGATAPQGAAIWRCLDLSVRLVDVTRRQSVCECKKTI